MQMQSVFDKYLKIELISLAAIFILWELIGELKIVPSYLFPSFSETLSALYSLAVSGRLGLNYFATLVRVLVGFGLGSSLGILTGLAIAYHEKSYWAFFPMVALAYAVPAVAWIPLFIIWIGLNEGLPIAVIFMCSFSPLVYIVSTSVRGLNPSIINVAKTLGCGDLDLTFRVLLPQILPSVMSGLKVEMGMAWRSCFVTEMVALSSGLGLLAIEAQTILRVDIILAVVLLLAVSNYAFQVLFEKIEIKILRKWGYLNA